MGAPKYKPQELNALYTRTQNQRDKELIEMLRERLNRKFQHDQLMGKKAALILEQWLKKK